MSCQHKSAFFDASVFLNILLFQSQDPPGAEKSFNNLKRTMVTFTSHLCIGEIFKKLSLEYSSELIKDAQNAHTMFTSLCLRAHRLLEGINILEVDSDVMTQFNEVLRENDSESRDRLLLSTAIGHKCTQFYTSDGKFIQRIKGKITKDIIKIKPF